MLTTRGEDCAVMTEGRMERRDGDVRFALVLDECVHCAQVNLDCFLAVVVEQQNILDQYVEDVLN